MAATSSTTRLSEVFTTGKRPAFVAFLTAGYPTLATTVPAMLAMQRGGVGLIEVGMPFSDPLADGGTIAKANQGALENGVTVKWTLAMIREARAAGLTTPIVLMGVRTNWCRPLSLPPRLDAPSAPPH
jgi:tryptophan synthase alpha subunit